MDNRLKMRGLWCAVLGLTLAIVTLPTRAAAQDDYQQQDDPPSRVARLGYMEGSVSMDPAGETDWVGADDNRPMTTGDKLWADKDSRAELQLGSAVIRLSQNTGVSFLNLDDRTVQLQLSSGSINVRVRRLDRDAVFEIDTPNLAFSIYQPGSYRLEASEDGTYSVVTIREGEGEATGNGQTYTLHAGQRGTFSGTDSLNADVEQVGDPDQFDNWAYNRDHRYETSRSAQYLSSDVVGYDDLDDNGDWRDEGDYGHVWFPHVAVGWAPYHEGHWAWIDPWGYTWVDDSPWGYAPFHYGRWVSVGSRWGWVAGPREERAVYAPALVVFIGAGGVGFGGNIGWFPLGPREVYVPSYPVSRAYVQRVNISSTTVNTTTITNVYNTTIINKSTTNVTNITYANRNVQGAVTAVPQHAFASAQPVAKAAVVVNARELAAAPVSARVAVNPTREAVLGARASTANRVTAPPAAVMNRQVIAKATPPPPPPSFAKQQQAMAAHPGQPLPKREMASLQPAATAAAHPMVKVAPPGKPATPTTGHPGNQPGNQPNPGRPGQPAPGAPANRPGQPATPAANQPANQPGNQPGNRPGNQPAPNERPGAANQPNRPSTAQPENRPGMNQPAPNNRPGQPENRPAAAQPENRPEPNQPNNRPGMNQPTPNNRPENRPPAAQPENRQPAAQPNNRPAPPENRQPAAQPNNRPAPMENRQPAAQPNNRPAPPENRQPAAQPNNRPAPPENRQPAAQPNNRPAPPENRQPAAQPNNRPAEPPARNERPPAAQPNNRPEPSRNEPAARPQTPPQNDRPPQHAAPPPPQKQQQKPQTPEEKKKQEEKKPPGL